MNDFVGELQEMIERGGKLVPDERRGNRPFDGTEKRTAVLERAEAGIGRIAAVVGSIVTIFTVLGLSAFFNNPLEMKANASEAHAAIQRQVDDSRMEIQSLKNRVDRIDTNTAKSLRLGLKGSIRELQANIEQLPRGSTARRQLEATLDQTQSDLDDVEAQLKTGK